MHSLGAQPGNFRAYRAQWSPWVGRPKYLSYCLLEVLPLGWALRAYKWRCSLAQYPVMGILYTGMYTKFRCAVWEFSSIQGAHE